MCVNIYIYIRECGGKKEGEEKRRNGGERKRETIRWLSV